MRPKAYAEERDWQFENKRERDRMEELMIASEGRVSKINDEWKT